MRIVFPLGMALFLAACSMSSTPRGGSCVARASTDLNALNGAILTAETNINRGFSVQRQLSEDGSQTEEVHIPVNIAKERQKLAELKARLSNIQTQTDTALAQCG